MKINLKILQKILESNGYIVDLETGKGVVEQFIMKVLYRISWISVYKYENKICDIYGTGSICYKNDDGDFDYRMKVEFKDILIAAPEEKIFIKKLFNDIFDELEKKGGVLF